MSAGVWHGCFVAAGKMRLPMLRLCSRTATRHGSSLAAAIFPQFPGLSPPGSLSPPPVFADGASGSQCHASVIEAVSEQLKYGFANVGGEYGSSERVGRAVDGARNAMAAFFHCQPAEVTFGPSMTALTFHLARALDSSPEHLFALGPGDEVLLDPLSHRANVTPWVWLAQQRGASVKWLPVADSGGACRLARDPDELASAFTPGRTKLVALGAASNGTGTVHDVAAICNAAQAVGALTFVDAVHLAAHHALDVQAWGCDFAVCSPYKFFGPHSGVLYGRARLMEALPTHQLDLATDELPHAGNSGMSRWELGTQSHEALAGILAAVKYLQGLGTQFGHAPPTASARERLVAGFSAIETQEDALKEAFLLGLQELQHSTREEGGGAGGGFALLGVADPARLRDRTPTFALHRPGTAAEDLASRLCRQGIWTTSGNHYTALWDSHSGGATSLEHGMARLGFLHYNTVSEVERVLRALRVC